MDRSHRTPLMAWHQDILRLVSLGDNDAPINGGLVRRRETKNIFFFKKFVPIYLFPKIDRTIYAFEGDQQLILDFLISEKILLVQGTAFNWSEPDHFRIVFLPQKVDLLKAIQKFGEYMQRYRIDK